MTPLHLCGRFGHTNLIALLKGKVPLSMTSEKVSYLFHPRFNQCEPGFMEAISWLTALRARGRGTFIGASDMDVRQIRI